MHLRRKSFQEVRFYSPSSLLQVVTVKKVCPLVSAFTHTHIPLLPTLAAVLTLAFILFPDSPCPGHGSTGNIGDYSNQIYHKDLLVTVEEFYVESCKYQVKSLPRVVGNLS